MASASCASDTVVGVQVLYLNSSRSSEGTSMSKHSSLSRPLTNFTAMVLVGLFATGCGPDSAATAPDMAVRLGKTPTVSNQRAYFTLLAPTDIQTQNLVGDGLFNSVYTDGKCGVTATVFAPNPTQDGNLQTGNPSASDKQCSPYGSAAVPRKVTVRYPDSGLTETSATTINVRDLGTVTSSTAALRPMSIGLNTGTRCARINFGNLKGGTTVLVTRSSSTTWHVQSPTGTTATCLKSNGVVESIGGTWSLDFTVTTF